MQGLIYNLKSALYTKLIRVNSIEQVENSGKKILFFLKGTVYILSAESTIFYQCSFFI